MSLAALSDLLGVHPDLLGFYLISLPAWDAARNAPAVRLIALSPQGPERASVNAAGGLRAFVVEAATEGEALRVLLETRTARNAWRSA